MMRAEKALIWTLGGLICCTGATATTGESSNNPYQGIVARNLFGLKPPPALPSPEDTKPPPPSIILTGIMTGFGGKRALFKTTPPATKPGEQVKEQSYMLSEGQRDGEIEVLEIAEQEPGTWYVKVKNFGTITNLTFEKNGAKLAAAPPPPGINPATGIPTPVQTGAPNPFTPAGAAGGFNKGLPPRSIRVPTTGGAQIAPPTGSTPQPATGFAPAPTPSINPSTQVPVRPQAALTREQDAVLTELERDQHRNDMISELLPPTSLTSPEDLQKIMAPGQTVPGVKSGGNTLPPRSF